MKTFTIALPIAALFYSVAELALPAFAAEEEEKRELFIDKPVYPSPSIIAPVQFPPFRPFPFKPFPPFQPIKPVPTFPIPSRPFPFPTRTKPPTKPPATEPPAKEPSPTPAPPEVPNSHLVCHPATIVDPDPLTVFVKLFEANEFQKEYSLETCTVYLRTAELCVPATKKT